MLTTSTQARQVKHYFHGGIKAALTANSLIHMGSLHAAASRGESMFAAQEERKYGFDGKIHCFTLFGRLIKQISVEEHIEDFCKFMANFEISEFEVTSINSLVISDTWEDDPIGSGGLSLFQDNHVLNREQRQALKALFSPFEGIITPDQIVQKISHKTHKKMSTLFKRHPIYRTEMKKRIARCKALGLVEKDQVFLESVWLYYTTKLCIWAKRNGFDSFSYQNLLEGKGESSVILLPDTAMYKTEKSWSFNSDAYRTFANTHLKHYMLLQGARNASSGQSVTTRAMWCDQDPVQFFVANH